MSVRSLGHVEAEGGGQCPEKRFAIPLAAQLQCIAGVKLPSSWVRASVFQSMLTRWDPLQIGLLFNRAFETARA